MTFVIWIGIGFAAGDEAIWNVAFAIVPLLIAVVFMPYSTQMLFAHVMLFPAAVAELPAATVTLAMSLLKEKLHWTAATCAPPDDARAMGTVTVPPGVDEADPMERAMLCPREIIGRARASEVRRRIRSKKPSVSAIGVLRGFGY